MVVISAVDYYFISLIKLSASDSKKSFTPEKTASFATDNIFPSDIVVKILSLMNRLLYISLKVTSDNLVVHQDNVTKKRFSIFSLPVKYITIKRL